MVNNIVLLIAAYGGGLGTIKNFPTAITLSDILTEYVLNPGKFFSLMVCFIFSFLGHSILVSKLINQFFRKKMEFVETFFAVLAITSFLLLFFQGFWQTVWIVLFSLIYTTISFPASTTVSPKSSGNRW